jgi:anti-sigma factor RsiW
MVSSLELYADDEACEDTQLEVEEHLRHCDACSDYVSWRVGLRDEMKRSVGASRLSPDARSRIAGCLAQHNAGAGSDSSNARRRSVLPIAGTLLAASVAGGVVYYATSVGRVESEDEMATSNEVSSGEVAGASAIRSPIVAEAIRWHRRQVPVEVNGPDAQRVGQWFVNKVEFPVRAPQLGHGATLLGGRIGNIANSDAAFLLYEVDGTKLSVFVFDSVISGLDDIAGADGQLYMDNSSGYNVAVGQRHGIGYAFASELPGTRFVEMVEHSIEE